MGKHLIRSLLLLLMRGTSSSSSSSGVFDEIIVLSRQPHAAREQWQRFASAVPLDSAGRVRFEDWLYLDPHSRNAADADANAVEREHESVCAVVNLTGRNVMQHRWAPQFREQVFQSRLSPTRKLLQFCDRTPSVQLMIGTSAVGYYHTVEDAIDQTRPFTEEHSKEIAPNAIGELCEDIERLVLTVDSDHGLRGSHREDLKRIVCRPAVVLAPDGGIIPQMAPMAAFAKPIMGTGNQPFPFIHIDDLCAAYATLLERRDSIEGGVVVNCVAPVSSETTWNDLVDEMARQMLQRMPARSLLGRVFPVRIPLSQSLLTRLMGDERATMLCEGSKIEPQRLRDLGFKFRFPDLESCLSDVCNRVSLVESIKVTARQMRSK